MIWKTCYCHLFMLFVLYAYYFAVTAICCRLATHTCTSNCCKLGKFSLCLSIVDFMEHMIAISYSDSLWFSLFYFMFASPPMSLNIITPFGYKSWPYLYFVYIIKVSVLCIHHKGKDQWYWIQLKFSLNLFFLILWSQRISTADTMIVLNTFWPLYACLPHS